MEGRFHRMARPDDTRKSCAEEDMQEPSVKAERHIIAPEFHEDLAGLRQTPEDPGIVEVREDDTNCAVQATNVNEDTEKSAVNTKDEGADLANECPLRSVDLTNSEDTQQPNFPSIAGEDPALPDLASSIVEAMQANVTDLPPVIMPTSRSVASIEVSELCLPNGSTYLSSSLRQ